MPSPVDLNNVSSIPGEECIGDSRERINYNIDLLKQAIENINGSLVVSGGGAIGGGVATSTCCVDLEAKLLTLSADFTNISQVTALSLITELSSQTASLSSTLTHLVSSTAFYTSSLDIVNVENNSGISLKIRNDENITSYHIGADNSIEYIKTESLKPINSTLISNYNLQDFSNIDFYNFPYTPITPPSVSFEVVAKQSTKPSLTVFWMSSGTNPTTVFATNSSSNIQTPGPISPNSEVNCIHMSSASTAYVGGDFTKISGNTRNRFAVLDLSNSGTNPLGVPSLIPSTTNPIGLAERNFLNSIASAGFNDTVRSILTFDINSKTYLCIGGDFTNVPPSNTAPTVFGQKLAIFDVTADYDANYGYVFDGSIYSMLSAGSYLYISGEFNEGKRTDNSSPTPMCGLARIDMTTLDIDYVFNDNILRPGFGLTNAGKNYPIYTLAYSNDILYCGGKHTAKLEVTGSNWTQYCISAHYTVGTSCGQVCDVSWQPYCDGPVTRLLVDENAKVLYVGGKFNNYENKLVPSSLTQRQNLMAFDITIADTPILINSWNPICDDSVNCLAIHDPTTSTTPLYVGGSFTTINQQNSKNIAAITKANSSGGMANLMPEWSPTPNSSFEWYHNPGIIRIPSINPLVGVVLHGSFTSIHDQSRLYLSRVNGYNETLTQPTSAVFWSIAGTNINSGSILNVTTSFTSMSGAALGPWQVNATKVELDNSSLPCVNRGDLCRFLLKRPCTRDTLLSPVWLLGVSVDFNH